MGNAVRVNGALYELVRPLTEGGFARVYEVRRDGRRFALKWTRGVADGEQLQRLQLEIQVMRQLQVVRNVLPLEAAELRRSADGQKEALLLFPLVESGSLQERLEQTAKRGVAAFTERACLGLFLQLLDAVAALHALGFAHRDLKPGNVLLRDGEQTEPLLMDFGSVAPLLVQVRGQMDARKLWEDDRAGGRSRGRMVAGLCVVRHGVRPLLAVRASPRRRPAPRDRQWLCELSAR